MNFSKEDGHRFWLLWNKDSSVHGIEFDIK